MYPEEDEAYLWVMSDSDKEAKWAKYQHITRCGKCNIFNCPGGATCVLVDPTICLMGAIAPVVGIASLLPTKPYHQGLGPWGTFCDPLALWSCTRTRRVPSRRF